MNIHPFGDVYFLLFRKFRSNIRNIDSQYGSLYGTVLLDVGNYLFNNAHGHSKGIARKSIGTRYDRRIDSDQFSSGIDQSASTIAGIHRSVGLNKRFNAEIGITLIPLYSILIIASQNSYVPALGTDNTRSNRRSQIQRITDGQHPLANLEFIGISEGNKTEALFFNFNQSNIGTGVGSNHFGLIITPVVESDRYFVGSFNNMIIGNNITVCRNDNSRTITGLGSRSLVVIPVTEEIFKNIQGTAAANRPHRFRSNVNDSMYGLVSSTSKVRFYGRNYFGLNQTQGLFHLIDTLFFDRAYQTVR